MSTNAELYAQDFYRWTQEQAALLEARQWEALDLLHLIEELESLGRRERHALYDGLIVLLAHLLKGGVLNVEIRR